MAKAINWGEIAQTFIKGAGGKNNIREAFNCATRLRFVVNDDSKVNKDLLKNIDLARGLNKDGTQWQLIIGAGTVNKVMDAVNNALGGGTDNSPLGKKRIEPLWDRRLRFHSNMFGITRRGVRGFAAIFIPLIPLFIAGGLALALNNLIGSAAETNSTISFDDLKKVLLNDPRLENIQESFNALVNYVNTATIDGTNSLSDALGNVANSTFTSDWGTLTGLDFNAGTTNTLSELYEALEKVKPSLEGIDSITGATALNALTLSEIEGITLQKFETLDKFKSYDNPDYDSVAAGFKSFFDHIGFAIFGSLPALVGYTAAKRWGGSPWLGLAVGLAISWGALTNSWAFYYATAPAEWDVGEFSLEAIGYQAQVVPALLSIAFMIVIEKIMKKICHESIAIIAVPLVTITLTVFCALWFIGPFGRIVGEGVADLFRIINDNVNFTGFGLGGMLFGFVYPFIVVTGLHQSFVPIELALVAESQATFITPIASIANVCQGMAAFMAVIFIRNQRLRATGLSGGISAKFGITEPALYGVNIPLKYPLIAGAIGSAAGGYWAGISRLHSASFGSASWLGLVQFDTTSDRMQQYFADNKISHLDPVLPELAPIGHAAIAMAIGTIVTAGVLLLLRKTKWAKKQLIEFKIDMEKTLWKDLPKQISQKWENYKKGWRTNPLGTRTRNYAVNTKNTTMSYLVTPKVEKKVVRTATKQVNRNIPKVTRVYSPFDGKVVTLENVPDEVFSQKMMGDGVAIMPTSGTVTSPTFGKIVSSFPTGHAYTIKSKAGHAVLLHIGLETVKLNGKGFKVTAKEGSVVNKDSKLCDVDLNIKKNVKSLVSPILAVNDPTYNQGRIRLVVKNGQQVKAGQPLFEIISK